MGYISYNSAREFGNKNSDKNILKLITWNLTLTIVCLMHPPSRTSGALSGSTWLPGSDHSDRESPYLYSCVPWLYQQNIHHRQQTEG